MLNPEDYAKGTSEHAQQVALFMWAALPETRAMYKDIDLMFAVPNGGLRNKATAGKLKAEGVKAGVPDVWLPVIGIMAASHSMFYHGLVIEMKKPGETSSAVKPKQREYLDRLYRQGYYTCVCYTFCDARDIVIAYYEGRL